MKNTDKILLSIILLLTIFGLLYLIYKNPSCYKKKEGFLYTDEVKAAFCNDCSPCEQLEQQKYHCQKKTMWGDFDVWNDESLTSEKQNEKLKHIAECYDTDCYEKCHNGPTAGNGKYTDASVCKHVDSTKNLKQEKIIKENDIRLDIAIKQSDVEQLAHIEKQKQIMKDIKTAAAAKASETAETAETATDTSISAHLLCVKNYNSLKDDYKSLNDHYKSLKDNYNSLKDDNLLLDKNNKLLLEKNNNLITVYDENNRLIVELTKKTNELKETRTECAITHEQLLNQIY